jgi:Kef-type K+ transport system membrane component KefB
MADVDVVSAVFVVFTGAAVLATAALFARQAMIVAYIAVGAIAGPSGFGLVRDAGWLEGVSEIGIMFLLYLLGLNMVPAQLWRMFREAINVTLLSSLAFLALGVALGVGLGFAPREAAVAGCAMMFSSTIIGLKLLPTTALHHQHMGQVIISILLLQDLIAIVALLLLQGSASGGEGYWPFVRQVLGLPVLIGVAYVAEHWVIEPLLRRFDQIQEYMFLLVIAWCLALAELAKACGLSHEIGAFVAGVVLATCPAALFIADALRPLRDFFLIMFFFTLGARLDPGLIGSALLPAAVLAGAALLAKPLVFSWLLQRAGEAGKLARETGVRLGQISEFSLLIVVLALDTRFIGLHASNVIQLATVLTFIVSSYLIVLRYPTPIAVRDTLRQD